MINQIIKGFEVGHTKGELQNFALTHGIKQFEFDEALDKAEIVRKYNLKVSTTEYALPLLVNIAIAAAYVMGSIFLFFYLIGSAFTGLFGVLSDGANGDLTPAESYEFSNPSSQTYVSLVGRVLQGEIKAEKVYLLDSDFRVIDLVERGGYAFALRQGSLAVKNQVDLDQIAFVAVTKTLAAAENVQTSRQPLLIIEEARTIANNTADITATLHIDDLKKSDGLYIYNEEKELIALLKLKRWCRLQSKR